MTNGMTSSQNRISYTRALALTTTPSTVPLAIDMPSSNVTYGANSINITESGDYEVNYSLAGTIAGNPSTVTLSVAENGAAIPSATISRALSSTGTNDIINGSAIVTLSAGDVLTLLASSSNVATFTPSTNVNSYLTVKRIDA